MPAEPPVAIDAAHGWPQVSGDGGRYAVDLGQRVQLVGELAAIRNYVGSLVRAVNYAIADAAPNLGPVDPGPGPGWSRAAQQLADYRDGAGMPDPTEGALRPIQPGEDW